ncbi:MAG: acyl-CoA thioesterase [Haloarculaceae archaeon]
MTRRRAVDAGATGTYETAVPVRDRDRGPGGRVTEVGHATHFDVARTGYMADAFGFGPADRYVVLAALSIDVRRDVPLGDAVTVGVEVPELGTSSFPMRYETRADGEVAATGESTQVYVDTETGRPRPLPDDLREAIETFEGRA